MTATSMAFFWGDDDLAAARAIDRLAAALSEAAGGPLDRLEIRGDRTIAGQLLDQLNERVATETMFGGGTLAVVTSIGSLTAKGDDRGALVSVLERLAPGNGVVFVESTATGAREPGQEALFEAIKRLGGEVRGFRAPKAGELAGWIETEARERGMRLAAGAARALASRIGGFVTDNDADRRNQTRMAAAELEKLALYRGETVVSADDVTALVAEAVPGSVWALADAVGKRDAAMAAELLDRLGATTPEPVLLAVLHRRIRELLEIGDLLATGTREETLPRTLGLHPFRVQQLAIQARRWSIDELQAALEVLLELDATVKGAPGHAGGDAQRRLGFTLWIAESVAPQKAEANEEPSRTCLPASPRRRAQWHARAR